MAVSLAAASASSASASGKRARDDRARIDDAAGEEPDRRGPQPGRADDPADRERLRLDQAELRRRRRADVDPDEHERALCAASSSADAIAAGPPAHSRTTSNPRPPRVLVDGVGEVVVGRIERLPGAELQRERHGVRWGSTSATCALCAAAAATQRSPIGPPPMTATWSPGRRARGAHGVVGNRERLNQSARLIRELVGEQVQPLGPGAEELGVRAADREAEVVAPAGPDDALADDAVARRQPARRSRRPRPPRPPTRDPGRSGTRRG